MICKSTVGIKLHKGSIQSNKKNVFLTGLLIGLGVLAKEFNISCILFVFLLLLSLKNKNVTESNSPLLTFVFLVAASIPILLLQAYTVMQFNYSYLDFFLLEIVERTAQSDRYFLDHVLNLVWSYWLAFGISIFFAILVLFFDSINRIFNVTMLLSFSIPNLLIFQTIFYARFAALTLPAIVLFAPRGINMLSGSIASGEKVKKVVNILIVLVIVGNVFLTKYFISIPIIFSLEIGLLLMCCLMLFPVAYLIMKKHEINNNIQLYTQNSEYE